MENQTVFPSLRYRDARAAVDWLGRAFGFEPGEVHERDGTIMHAELSHRGSLIMVGTARDDEFGGPTGQGWVYVVVDDADAHYAQAKEAGAEIVYELADQDYGSRDYSARDPEGNLWSFGTYQPS